jgi:hypothetical protein
MRSGAWMTLLEDYFVKGNGGYNDDCGGGGKGKSLDP